MCLRKVEAVQSGDLGDEPLGKLGVEFTDDDERAALETLGRDGSRGVIHLGTEKVARQTTAK